MAAETDTERRAADLAKDAIQRDYKAGRHKAAEKRLRQAIELCLKGDCTVPFRARLNRDLGIVYVGGMRRVEAGKDEFATALTADPTVAIPRPLNTRPVNTAFVEVRSSLAGESAGSPAAEEGLATKRTKLDSATPYSPSTDEGASSSTSWRDVANWITFGGQQDFMVHSATQYACNTGSSYVCYDDVNAEANWTNRSYRNGNEISSSGVRLASTRILIGYERLLFKNLAIGLKAGGLVLGAAQRRTQDNPIQRHHIEGRLTVYPGSDPFSPTTHFRPYLFGSGGTTETDSKIIVEVIDANNQVLRFRAWRRARNLFAGAGLGFMFPIRQSNGPFLEARLMHVMGSGAANTMSVMGGYAIGF